MLGNKITLLVAVILITKCSKVSTFDHHNDLDENEKSENEYGDVPSIDGWQPDANAINIQEPYLNILDGKEEERTNFDNPPPSKTSDNPIPNPPSSDDQGGLNMSNPLSKNHCPVNLLYGNNLTVKNFFLLIPRCNMSANDTLEEINKSEIEQGRLQEGHITIPPSTSEKEIGSFIQPTTEPQTRSSTEIFGMLSSSNGEYGATKSDFGSSNANDSVTSSPKATDVTVSVTNKSETTYSVDDNVEETRTVTINAQTTGLQFNNSETTGSTTSRGEKTGSTTQKNEQSYSINNNGETSGSVFRETTRSITITEGTTGSVLNNDVTLRSKSISVDKTSSATVKSETITCTNINRGTSSSIFNNGETIVSIANGGENTGTVTVNGESTDPIIKNDQNTGSVTESAETSGVVSSNCEMTEDISPGRSTYVSIEKEGSYRTIAKSTLVDEFTKVSLATQAPRTTLCVFNEALRTIDKYCETFSLVLSYRETYTSDPVNVGKKPAEDILNDVYKFNAYMPGVSEKKKRTVFNKNRRKYFKNNIVNLYK